MICPSTRVLTFTVLMACTVPMPWTKTGMSCAGGGGAVTGIAGSGGGAASERVVMAEEEPTAQTNPNRDRRHRREGPIALPFSRSPMPDFRVARTPAVPIDDFPLVGMIPLLGCAGKPLRMILPRMYVGTVATVGRKSAEAGQVSTFGRVGGKITS